MIMYLCNCLGLKESAFRAQCVRSILAGKTDMTLRTDRLQCCKCVPRIKELFNEAKQAHEKAEQYYEAGHRR